MIAGALRDVPGITSLDLGKNKITEHGARAIARELRYVPKLVSLGLAENFLRDNGVVEVTGALRYVPGLTSLDLSMNDFGLDGSEALTGALRHVPGLTSLDLSENAVDAHTIAVALSGALTSLNLFSCQISEQGATVLAEHLSRLAGLVYLDIGNNQMGNATRTVIRALPGGVVSLGIANIGPGDEDAEAIAARLSSLVELDLSGSDPTPRGVGVLSEAFRGARLKKLILSRNRALVAASAPVLSLSLVHLELAFNVLETRLSWLSRLSGLVFLDLRYNSMGAEGAEVLAHALAGHNNLVHLDLSYNSIGMALHGRARMSRFMGLKRMDRMYGVLNRTLVGIKAITGMMLPTLETLILAGNDIDNDGARLVSLVRTETIDLRNNRIDAQGAKRLAKALGNRSVSLDLSGNDLVREDVEKFFAPRIRLRV